MKEWEGAFGDTKLDHTARKALVEWKASRWMRIFIYLGRRFSFCFSLLQTDRLTSDTAWHGRLLG
jgi:hypothetical protein